jgi:hypothetical protein
MYKPYLIGVLGYSRAGKDTLAKPFIDRGYRSLAMAGFMKRTIEQMYGLPHGAMEDPEHRGALIRPGDPEVGTYLEMMVALAAMWRKLDPLCMVTPMLRDLLEVPQATIITGIRFKDEVDMFVDPDIRAFYQPVLYRVLNSRVAPLQSDSEVAFCESWATLSGLQPIRVANEGSLRDFQAIAAIEASKHPATEDQRVWVYPRDTDGPGRSYGCTFGPT